MWYPFKFWRKVGYVYVTGRLAELFGQSDHRPKRRTLRAVDRAKEADGGYLIAVPDDDWRFVAVEGWATCPDRSFRSVTARFVDDVGRDLWVQTSTGRRGALGLLDPGPGGHSLFEGDVTTTEGRVVEVAHLAGVLSEPPRIAGTMPLAELPSG